MLHDLAFAKSVGTEPVTSDDWEIIVGDRLRLDREISCSCLLQELHAAHVESTLLSQVRVAAVGQEIDIWVLGRTRVRLRVGKLTNTCADMELNAGYSVARAFYFR